MSKAINLNHCAAVVLAAGKGTRLGCVDIPKVMLELNGKPIVAYTVETLEKMGLGAEQICLVVGFKKEKVKAYFDGRVSFADQEEQLGTAHAAYVGMTNLPKHITQVVVLGGDDSAFYTPETLQHFIAQHEAADAVLSLLSVTMDEPANLGRVVRHDNGDIEIIEKEYTTPEQKLIKEVSTGTFCFDRQWFEDIFPNMPQLRKLGEYGLPTAMAMAREQNVPYQIVMMKHADEWFGVNTSEQLKEARQRKGEVE